MTRAADRGAAGLDLSAGLPKSSYWRQSELPLASLMLVLPLVIVYELGTRFFTTGALAGRSEQIRAFVWLQRFFSLFGADGRHLPALAVVGVLLAWHIARHDRWNISLQTVVGMAFESVVWAIPVLVLGYALTHYLPLAGATEPKSDLLVLSLGAGVYEELVFRLILFAYLTLILRDAFQFKPASTSLLMVVISGVLFALYHYLSPWEVFRANTFVFRTLAGIYFGVLFLTRGYGITAASHSAYDILIVVLAKAAA